MVLICNQIIAGVSELEPQAFHAVFARHCFERHTFARHDFRQLTFERYTFAWQAAHLVLFYFILFYLAQPSSHCAWVPRAFTVVPQVLRSVVCLACSRLEHYQALHAEETKKKNHQSFRNTFTSHYNKHGKEGGILSMKVYPTRLQHNTSLGYPIIQLKPIQWTRGPSRVRGRERPNHFSEERGRESRTGRRRGVLVGPRAGTIRLPSDARCC
jgi:hypothetical protein